MQPAKSWKSLSMRPFIFGVIVAAGMLLHFGTAVLRLNSFVPYPQLVDFGSFYVGALLLAQQHNPYQWTQEVALIAQNWVGLGIPVPNSTPTWLWLTLPWTWLPFPIAATLWLAFLLLVSFICSVLLARMAGYFSWTAATLIFVLVVTFGPTFLTLTLGQNSILLLLAVLLIGNAITSNVLTTTFMAATIWSLAIFAKLFPILWVVPVLRLRKWRLLMTLAIIVAGLSVSTYLASTEVSHAYWFSFLVERTDEFSGQGSLDDQALGAWIDRIGRGRTVDTTVVSLDQTHSADWRPPWEIAPDHLKLITNLLLILILIAVSTVLWLYGKSDPIATLNLWVLYGTLVVPHMERYNHVLLLPAMAWLWARNDNARFIVVLAYFFAGLARLTHYWALVLPAPYGPVATGFGVIAVLLLLATITFELLHQTPKGRLLNWLPGKRQLAQS